MNKEIAIKVRVEGEEVTMAGKQLDAFKKTIENLKKQLTELGARTEENGEQFDKLKGDLDALNSTFNDTSTEVKTTTDNLDKNETQVVQNEKVTKSYAAEIRSLSIQLAQLGDRTQANGAQYDALQQKIKNLRDKQEDLQFGTRKLDDALSAIPGTIGNIASKFKMFDDGLKNSKSALKGLTAQFPILKSAIVSTGIGALVIIFGLLAAAVMKAFQTFKPLQKAVDNLKMSFGLVLKAIQPVIDIIGKGLTIAVEGFAKAVAWVTGNLKEYNEELANSGSSEIFVSRIKKMNDDLNREYLNASEARKKEIDEIKEHNNKIIELEKKFNNEENDYLVSRYERHQQLTEDEKVIINEYKVELQKLNSEVDANRTETQNNGNNDALQRQKEFYDSYLKLENEQKLLSLKTDKEKQEELLKQQYESEKRQLSGLKNSNILLLKLDEVYALRKKELAENLAEDLKKIESDLKKQLRDIRNSLIEDEQERARQEAIARRQDALMALEGIVASDELLAQLRLAIWDKYWAEFDKLGTDNFNKHIQLVKNQTDFERQTVELGYQNQLNMIEIFGKSYEEKIIAIQGVLDEQAKSRYDNEIEDLKTSLSNKEITQIQFLERSNELNKEYNLALIRNELDTQAQIIEAKMNMVNALANLGTLLGQSLSETSNFLKSLGKEYKSIAITAIIVEKLAAIAQIVANTAIANAKSVAAFPITAGQPWVTINTVAAGLSIAGLIASSANSIAQINAEGKSTSTSTGATSTPNYGKNYESGGEIKGKRHAQGGTIIEAEDGEAIMNRGSVAMFKPMLSLMNQMGGGKAFDARVIQNDNPITKQPNKEPLIIKTFVVESELTSQQNKQARLKNLSTI